MHYLLLLVMMGFGALLDVVGVGAVPAFVATLAVPEKVFAYPVARDVLPVLGITSGIELVIWGCVGLMIVFILKNAYLSALYYMQIRITERHRVRLSDQLFTAYMKAPYEFHLSRNSAELLRNVQTETREVIVGIINPIVNLTMAALMTAGIIALLIFTMPPIVLVAVAIVSGGSAIFLRIFRKRLKRYGEEAKRERKEAIKAVNQGLSTLVDARILGREDFFAAAFYRSMAHFARVDRLRQFIGKSANLILESIAVIGLLVIVIGLALSNREMATLVPMLALFGAAILRLRASIGTIVASVSHMHYSIAAVPLVADEIAMLEGPGWKQRTSRKPTASESPVSPLPFEHELVVDHATYTYPGAERPALRDVCMTISKGSSVAFVGSTGSGKTTLVNVLLGLLPLKSGSIKVDGTEIADAADRWHALIGYIPQTIYLLDDTIRRNIALGIPDDEIDDEKVLTAIQAAQLEEFIATLDSGLDTMVGERGVRISGGQRQRVGLARALYQNPEILIMDEATSALDNHTENLVMQALEALREGRTFIMIAHRLSTVQKCDRLYFLQDGRIEAEGTYETLAASHGEFRRMAEVV